MIQAPEGAVFYFADAADQAAVRLMADVDELPPDLDFKELESFEASRLAAERVKVDLWRLLRSVWSASWGEALASLVHARPFTLAEHDDCLGDGDDYSPTVETAWEDRWSGWGYHWNDGALLTGVRIDEAGRLSLIVYAVDAKGRADDRLGEVEGWDWEEREVEQWWMWRSDVLAGSAEIDVKTLKASALEMAAHLSFHSA